MRSSPGTHAGTRMGAAEVDTSTSTDWRNTSNIDTRRKFLASCRAVIISKPLLIKAIASLRHAYAQPGLSRDIADGLILPAIQKLDTVLEQLAEHHDEVAGLVHGATVARATVEAQLARAEATLQQIMQALGPSADGARADVAQALDALHAYGVHYQPPDPDQ